MIFAFSFKWYLKIKSQEFHQNLDSFYKHCSEEIILLLACSPKGQLKFGVPDCFSYTSIDQMLPGFDMRLSNASNTWTRS